MFFFFFLQSPGNQSVSQAPIKTKRGKKEQKFYNPEKSARISLTHRLLFGWGNQFPHLCQDSMIPTSSMDGITLFHYILIERCEAFIVAICQGPLPGDVWEIMLHREPPFTHLLHSQSPSEIDLVYIKMHFPD